jgi:hypothetical protein
MFPKFRSITVIGCFQERNVVIECMSSRSWGELGVLNTKRLRGRLGVLTIYRKFRSEKQMYE